MSKYENEQRTNFRGGEIILSSGDYYDQYGFQLIYVLDDEVRLTRRYKHLTYSEALVLFEQALDRMFMKENVIMEMAKIMITKKRNQVSVVSSVPVQVFIRDEAGDDFITAYDDTKKKYKVTYEVHEYKTYVADVYARTSEEAHDLICMANMQDLADDPSRTMIDHGYTIDDAVTVCDVERIDE